MPISWVCTSNISSDAIRPILPSPKMYVMLEKAHSNHLQGTEVCFQPVSNQNSVCTDKAQQYLLDLPKGGVVTLHIFLTDSCKPIDRTVVGLQTDECNDCTNFLYKPTIDWIPWYYYIKLYKIFMKMLVFVSYCGDTKKTFKATICNF